MTELNPYDAPMAPLTSATPEGDGGSTSAGAVEILRSTKPWVRLLGVLSAIGMGFMVLGSVFVMVAAGSSRLPGLPAGIGLIYLLVAGFYLPPVIFLNRYASRIGDLLASHSTQDLEAALRAQKSFWKYVGIVAVIFIALYLLVIVGVAIFAGLAATKRF